MQTSGTESGKLYMVPKRILVVEDDIQLNRMYMSLLPRHFPGGEVEAVENGQAALECFTGKHYDLVITYMSMLVLNGHSLCIRIRDVALAASRHEPTFIFCTGVKSCLNILKEYMSVSRCSLLTKQFKINQLVDAAVSLLDLPSPASPNLWHSTIGKGQAVNLR